MEHEAFNLFEWLMWVEGQSPLTSLENPSHQANQKNRWRNTSVELCGRQSGTSAVQSSTVQQLLQQVPFYLHIPPNDTRTKRQKAKQSHPRDSSAALKDRIHVFRLWISDIFDYRSTHDCEQTYFHEEVIRNLVCFLENVQSGVGWPGGWVWGLIFFGKSFETFAHRLSSHWL